MADHVHICTSIPSRYSVSNVVGYLKEKSAIAIARRFKGKQRNFVGEHFWVRGYYVSTEGLKVKSKYCFMLVFSRSDLRPS